MCHLGGWEDGAWPSEAFETNTLRTLSFPIGRKSGRRGTGQKSFTSTALPSIMVIMGTSPAAWTDFLGRLDRRMDATRRPWCQHLHLASRLFEFCDVLEEAHECKRGTWEAGMRKEEREMTRNRKTSWVKVGEGGCIQVWEGCVGAGRRRRGRKERRERRGRRGWCGRGQLTCERRTWCTRAPWFWVVVFEGTLGALLAVLQWQTKYQPGQTRRPEHTIRGILY